MINDIDSTAAEMLTRLNKELEREGIKLTFAELKDPVMEKTSRAGLHDQIGKDKFYESLDDGVEAYRIASEQA